VIENTFDYDFVKHIAVLLFYIETHINVKTAFEKREIKTNYISYGLLWNRDVAIKKVYDINIIDEDE